MCELFSNDMRTTIKSWEGESYRDGFGSSNFDEGLYVPKSNDVWNKMSVKIPGVKPGSL